MKHILAALLFTSFLASCANTTDPAVLQRRQNLATIGNAALIAARIGGVLQPAEAAFIRDSGKLILNADGKGQETQLMALSDKVVTYAEDTGKITQEQAAELRQAGEVPLVMVPPAIPPVVPLTGIK